MKKSVVAILRTNPKTVLDDYIKLCDLANLNDALDKSQTVILKDNITWHYFYPGVNTTPWQLEGVILALKKNGFNDIVVVHNKTVVTNPYIGERENNYLKVYEKYNIKKLFNFKKSDMNWIIFKPKGEMLVLHKIFPEGILVPDYFIGKNIIHLPTVKTHSYTTTTGAMKNAFGGLLNTKRHYTHTWIHETLVDLLTIQKEIHTGIFAVMDGTTAASGPGPRTVTPYEKNIILASSDQVAIDAVAMKIMGFDPMKIPYTKIAHEKGLGKACLSEIEIVGDEDIIKENWNFKVGFNFATGTGLLLWKSPLKIFQYLLFRTPLVYLFVYASAIYHDKIWYKFIGKKRVNKWMKESQWSELFEKYK